VLIGVIALPGFKGRVGYMRLLLRHPSAALVYQTFFHRQFQYGTLALFQYSDVQERISDLDLPT
jgi:hypothetical protein